MNDQIFQYNDPNTLDAPLTLEARKIVAEFVRRYINKLPEDALCKIWILENSKIDTLRNYYYVLLYSLLIYSNPLYILKNSSSTDQILLDLAEHQHFAEQKLLNFIYVYFHELLLFYLELLRKGLRNGVFSLRTTNNSFPMQSGYMLRLQPPPLKVELKKEEFEDLLNIVAELKESKPDINKQLLVDSCQQIAKKHLIGGIDSDLIFECITDSSVRSDYKIYYFGERDSVTEPKFALRINSKRTKQNGSREEQDEILQLVHYNLAQFLRRILIMAESKGSFVTRI
jgi:hypothetical protein